MESEPEFTEEMAEAALARMKERMRAEGLDPGVMLIRGTLMMLPEFQTRGALEALDRLAARATPQERGSDAE